MDRFTFSGITNRLIGNLLHKLGGSMVFIKLKQSIFFSCRRLIVQFTWFYGVTFEMHDVPNKSIVVPLLPKFTGVAFYYLPAEIPLLYITYR